MKSTFDSESVLKANLTLWQKLLRMNWLMVFLILILGAISVVVVYSATFVSDKEAIHNLYRLQIVWETVGLFVFFFLSFIDYRVWLRYAFWGFGAIILLLILVLKIGKGGLGAGAHSWIRFGPIGFQPCEFAKLGFILFLARLFVESTDRGLKMFLVVLLFVIVPTILIAKQPALGSALVFLPTAYAMMFIAGIKNRYLLTSIACAGILAVYLAWCICLPPFNNDPARPPHIPFLKPFQEERLLSFTHHSSEHGNSAVEHSLNAIASAGPEGKGFEQGTMVNLGYLPTTAAYDDYIFPVLCEQWGFIGGGTLIVLLGVLLLMIVRIAFSTSDAVGTYIATGIAVMLLTHIFVNVGMTIQVVPVTGIPLPFISYGGTFLVVCLASLGLMQSIWIHRRND